MDKEILFNLYEKTYFYEMDVREKLVARVQINFALIATGYAILSYMIRMLDTQQNFIIILLFSLSVFISFALSVVCIIYLVKAFWGNEYQCMPTAQDIDSYRIKLISHKDEIDKYNTKYPDAAQPKVEIYDSMKGYLYNKFRDCSSHNTIINERRSAHIHKSFGWLLYSCIPFFIASSLFIAGFLDISAPTKKSEITNRLLLENIREVKLTLKKIESQKGVQMSDNKPPPPPIPPSQPEPRKVIEDDQPRSKM